MPSLHLLCIPAVSLSQAACQAPSTSSVHDEHELPTVTLRSQDEADFVFSLLPSGTQNFWIGLYQPANSEEPLSSWTWITGEPLEFTSWFSGEPNNNGNENAGIVHGNSPMDTRSGHWQDVYENNFPSTFVIEYEPPQLTPTLFYTRTQNTLTLTWLSAGDILQQATNLTGSPDDWTDLGAGLSPHSVSVGSEMKYFRLKR